MPNHKIQENLELCKQMWAKIDGGVSKHVNKCSQKRGNMQKFDGDMWRLLNKHPQKGGNY